MITAVVTFQRFIRAEPSTLDVPDDFFQVPASFKDDLKEKHPKFFR